MKRLFTILALTALTAACDADPALDGQSAPDARTDGIATEPWDQYCTITFTRDVTERLRDYGGLAQPEPFVFAEGTTWLVDQPSGDTIWVIYIGDRSTAKLPIDHDAADPGFESSCDLEAAQVMYGVFADVTLYADEALTQPACDLAAGTAIPTGLVGSQFVGRVSLRGENTVELLLGGLSAACGGRETAFTREGSLRVGDVVHNAPRITAFLAPAE